MDDVVFDGLRAKCSRSSSFALCFITADRIGGFEIETGVEQTLQNANPRFVFAVVEREGQDAARFQNTICFTPAVSEDALVKSIRVVRMSCSVGNRFKCLWDIVRLK